MPDANALDKYYKTLTDQELLNLGRQGGFTEEAEQVLRKELSRRNLGPHDVKQYTAATERSSLQDEVVERGGGYRRIGLQFFGKSYLNESDRRANIQIWTKWFTIGGIPLIPIASYRFKCASSSGKRLPTNMQQRVIDRVPLSWSQVFIVWIKTAIITVGVGLLIVGVSWYLDRRGR